MAKTKFKATRYDSYGNKYSMSSYDLAIDILRKYGVSDSVFDIADKYISQDSNLWDNLIKSMSNNQTGQKGDSEFAIAKALHNRAGAQSNPAFSILNDAFQGADEYEIEYLDKIGYYEYISENGRSSGYNYSVSGFVDNLDEKTVCDIMTSPEWDIFGTKEAEEKFIDKYGYIPV